MHAHDHVTGVLVSTIGLTMQVKRTDVSEEKSDNMSKATANVSV